MSEIAIIYFREQSCRRDISDEAAHYYHKAIKALEKQTNRPVNHKKTFWHYYHHCPTCNALLARENVKYCDNCGQRLDWSSYWEALK
jgi:hypothetical protein